MLLVDDVMVEVMSARDRSNLSATRSKHTEKCKKYSYDSSLFYFSINLAKLESLFSFENAVGMHGRVLLALQLL